MAGRSYGTSTCSTYAAKASPPIHCLVGDLATPNLPAGAPLMTKGAIKAAALRPAIEVCVPNDFNGASKISLLAHRDHPRWRVRLVLTEVSSMNTTHSGRVETAGRRCLIQEARCFLTLARRRSVATTVDFECNPELAQKPANRAGMHLNACRIRRRTGRLWHGHITALINQFDQKGAIRIKFALAARATLRRGRGLSGALNRKAPTRPSGG